MEAPAEYCMIEVPGSFRSCLIRLRFLIFIMLWHAHDALLPGRSKPPEKAS